MRRILRHVGWRGFGFVFLPASHSLSANLSANACEPLANRHSYFDFQSISFSGNVADKTVEGMSGLNTLRNRISIGGATSPEGSCNVNVAVDQSAGISAFSQIEHVSHHVALRFLQKTSKSSLFKNRFVLPISITHQSGFRMICIFTEQGVFSQSRFF